MVRQDKTVTPSVSQKLQDLGYSVADWDGSGTKVQSVPEIVAVLKTASKNGSGNVGVPDRIYINKYEKLLILVEEKSAVKMHDADDKENGAVSGVKWYLSRFANSNLGINKGFFDDWHILGIAVSGDLSEDYKHKFACFQLSTKDDKITQLPQVTNFMPEYQFLALFKSLDEEDAVAKIAVLSKLINNLLRSIDSQKRPILLSACMIALYKGNNPETVNNFPAHYKTLSPIELISALKIAVKTVLTGEGIPSEKLTPLEAELAFLNVDQTLRNQDILKQILEELETAVIPLFIGNFATNSNYDIVGKFYEEFLKYAGVSNVKKGIILTPRHITTLFTKLVPLKDNDRIVDLCCGTGAFLIAGMNELMSKINGSSRTDKNEVIKNIKTNQLLGFELNATMYICAISSMLFRGDGKSAIYNLDSINSPEAERILQKFKPTVGFINPPYSGKENASDPTPKEITFLTKMLDNCSRYGVIIAPLSTFFKDDNVRDGILEKHTLKYVINVPKDLFQPNAMAHTAIAVFETNRAFNYAADEVIFYDLRDDGFVLSKNKGRTDVYGKWAKIEKQLLDALDGKIEPDDITLVKTKIKPKDEWIIYAHSKTDYSTLSDNDFVKSITDYMVFEAKRGLDILDKNLSEIELLTALDSYYGNGKKEFKLLKPSVAHKKIDTVNWKEFTLTGKNGLFKYQHGKRLTVLNRITGETPLITAGQYNQGYAQGIANYDESELFAPGITVDMFSNAFYQPFKFAADDNIYVYNAPQPLNKYTALFLTTIIKKQLYKYGYGRQFRKEDSDNNIIILPADKSGNPDWQYMEDYIKSLPYSDLI
jgi:type I restriction-modification system DNA methylase subunit